MKKIDFVNGTTIDGAKTFNDMQNNVEEVFNGEEPMGSIVVEDISCKNKFNFDAITVPNGTVNYANKTITVRTFANGTEQTLKQLCPDLEVGRTYTLSFKTTGNSNFIHLFGTSTNWMNGTTHVITQADLDNTIVVYGNYEVDADVVISEIQIEKGSTATEYTPYKKFGYNSTDSMGKIVVDDISCKNLIPCLETETITLSKHIVFDKPLTHGEYTLSVESITTDGALNLYLFEFIDVNNTGQYVLLSNNVLSATFATSTELNEVYVYSQNDYANSQNITTIFKKIMLEKGDTATPYTPYKNFEGRTDIITGQECPTNEYVDGKRVYVKRINLGTLPNASNVTVATGLTMSNVNVVKITGIAKASDGATRILPYIDIWTNGNGTTIYITSDGNLNFYTNGDWSSYTGYVEIYYTKPDTSSVSTTSLEETE